MNKKALLFLILIVTAIFLSLNLQTVSAFTNEEAQLYLNSSVSDCTSSDCLTTFQSCLFNLYKNPTDPSSDQLTICGIRSLQAKTYIQEYQTSCKSVPGCLTSARECIRQYQAGVYNDKLVATCLASSYRNNPPTTSGSGTSTGTAPAPAAPAPAAPAPPAAPTTVTKTITIHATCSSNNQPAVGVSMKIWQIIGGFGGQPSFSLNTDNNGVAASGQLTLTSDDQDYIAIDVYSWQDISSPTISDGIRNGGPGELGEGVTSLRIHYPSSSSNSSTIPVSVHYPTCSSSSSTSSTITPNNITLEKPAEITIDKAGDQRFTLRGTNFSSYPKPLYITVYGGQTPVSKGQSTSGKEYWYAPIDDIQDSQIMFTHTFTDQEINNMPPGDFTAWLSLDEAAGPTVTDSVSVPIHNNANKGTSGSASSSGSGKKVTAAWLSWDEDPSNNRQQIFSINDPSAAQKSLDLSLLPVTTNCPGTTTYNLHLEVYFDDNTSDKTTPVTISYTCGSGGSSGSAASTGGTGTNSQSGSSGTTTDTSSITGPTCTFSQACGNSGVQTCPGKFSGGQCVFAGGTCDPCKGEVGSPNRVCTPGSYDVQCTKRCVNGCGEAAIRQCSSDGTSWSGTHGECSSKCSQYCSGGSAPQNGSACTYPETCPSCSGGVHTCHGKVQDGVCKYDPGTPPNCS